MYKLVSLIICLLFGAAYSWNGHTHVMVARVAYDILAASNPGTLSKANSLLAVFMQSNPSITVKEKNYPFVECVTLADDMKYNGWSWQSNWHFVDTPWLDEGGSMSDFPPYTGYDEHNITAVITDMIMWLKGTSGYKDTYAYKTITSHYSESDGKSIALRLVLHLFGDLHQPLHNMNRVDPDFPYGDKGGNDFPLKYHYDVDELHALWDTVIYENHNSQPLPFNSTSWDSFGVETNKMVSKYTFSTSDKQNINVINISADAYKTGTTGLYDGLTMNDVVPQPYIDKYLTVAEQRVVLGGQRLAYLMTTIFPNNAENEESTFLQ